MARVNRYKKKQYSDILGYYAQSSASSKNAYINGIIKTNYLERHQDLFLRLSKANQEELVQIYREQEYFDFVINNIPEKDKSKMLVIGDSQSSDILGGINSGIDTCWFNNENSKAEYKSTYTITRLCDLKEIL